MNEESKEVKKLEYKIKTLSKQKNKYNNLLVLNMVFVLSTLVVTKQINTLLWLNIAGFILTVVIGIYVLIMIKQCRVLLSNLIENFIKKSEGNVTNNRYKISKLQDLYTYLIIIINVYVMSNSLSFALI